MDMVTQTEEKRQAEKNRRISDVYDWAGTAIFALIFIVIVFTFLFRIVGVDGDSMNDTLQNGDRLVLTGSFGYTPQQGDIVVINRYTQQPLIKRVIALEGQKIEITMDGRVLVDDEEIDEPYVKGGFTPQRDLIQAQVVPEGYVFVMGDHRSNSHDSRSQDIGFINVEDIVGKAVFRLWPFDKIGGL